MWICALSAGIGRSGTFVAILWLIQLCARGILPDVRLAVRDLRRHRVLMVQNVVRVLTHKYIWQINIHMQKLWVNLAKCVLFLGAIYTCASVYSSLARWQHGETKVRNSWDWCWNWIIPNSIYRILSSIIIKFHFVLWFINNNVLVLQTSVQFLKWHFENSTVLQSY